MTLPRVLLVGLLTLCAPLAATELIVDESPAVEEEWGFRPSDGAVASLNPPRFSWRPQMEARDYVVEASRDASFSRVDYRAERVEFIVHAPPILFEPGQWHWRFRYRDGKGMESRWSGVRSFTVPSTAVEFPLPPRDQLLARVPGLHPRLFLRPEQMGALRDKAKGELKPLYDELVRDCEKLLNRRTDTTEPPTYPPGTEVKSEQWREYWSGNMRLVPQILTPAVTLGFTYQIGGDKRFGLEARRILLDTAKWDPHGATGYLYNDEAGMPYNYLFSRAYSYIYDLLSEDERKLCRDVMRVRGNEMYEHLCPSHFWTPYRSHQNRAWHFLGEVAIAFHGEIPEADDWLWFALNVFANVYPVWNDEDGGWHEGIAYWRSYMDRFTWWADAMKPAVGLDAYRLPFFSRVGDYAMYLQPPGTTRGGFGDQTTTFASGGNARLMAVFAAQAQNPYWQWYAETNGLKSVADRGDYLAFLRAATLPRVMPKPPTDLPSSKAFRGVGQAFLNSNLLNGKDNIEVLFKSSPFGTVSHGYSSQNAFELYAFGRPLLIQSGQRDIYGSEHHADWMWETKSVNSITVSGRGQVKHSPLARGRITAFETTRDWDFAQGDAAQAYEPALKKFTRSILFAKPGLIVIYDRLETETPETFEWRLHAPTEMRVDGSDVFVANGESACRVTFLAPTGMAITQTDRFDPPPRERIQLREFHLTAATKVGGPGATFVTVIQPYRATGTVPAQPVVLKGGVVRAGDLAIQISDRPVGRRDLELLPAKPGVGQAASSNR